MGGTRFQKAERLTMVVGRRFVGWYTTADERSRIGKKGGVVPHPTADQRDARPQHRGEPHPGGGLALAVMVPLWFNLLGFLLVCPLPRE